MVSKFKVEEIENLEVGHYVELRVINNSDHKVSGVVSYISEEEKGQVVVVVKSTKNLDNIWTSNKVEFEIIKSTKTGFKIPHSAIMERDGKKGVYVIKDSVYKFIEIEPVLAAETEVLAVVGNHVAVFAFNKRVEERVRKVGEERHILLDRHRSPFKVGHICEHQTVVLTAFKAVKHVVRNVNLKVFGTEVKVLYADHYAVRITADVLVVFLGQLVKRIHPSGKVNPVPLAFLVLLIEI